MAGAVDWGVEPDRDPPCRFHRPASPVSRARSSPKLPSCSERTPAPAGSLPPSSLPEATSAMSSAAARGWDCPRAKSDAAAQRRIHHTRCAQRLASLSPFRGDAVRCPPSEEVPEVISLSQPGAVVLSLTWRPGESTVVSNSEAQTSASRGPESVVLSPLRTALVWAFVEHRWEGKNVGRE